MTRPEGKGAIEKRVVHAKYLVGCDGTAFYCRRVFYCADFAVRGAQVHALGFVRPWVSRWSVMVVRPNEFFSSFIFGLVSIPEDRPINWGVMDFTPMGTFPDTRIKCVITSPVCGMIGVECFSIRIQSS